MQIRLDRSEFLSELAPMQGIVERRSTIPVLSHILLQVEDNQLHIAATDLDVSLTSSVAGDVDEAGGIAIQAKKFLEIVRAVDAEQVELKIEGENQLAILAGRSRFKLLGLSPDDFPTLPEIAEDGKVGIPFGLLKRMIAQVLFAVSTEESRFQLNGALLEERDDAFALVATDGYRLAMVENPLDGMKKADGVLVPRKALQELLRFEFDGEVVFRRSEHHLSFGLGSRELSCRILEGNFPDYERVIARDNDRPAVYERKALLDAVQRVALLTGDRARGVRLELEEGHTTISAANPDLGEAVEDVPCEFEGSSIAFGVNPDYLAQFLVACTTDQVRFELKDENSQAVGFPVEGEDKRYLCVIMPMRV
jgi:DNA polymerase-3 subunit beta